MREFSGEALAQIRFPLGGIGTGTVSLAGRGALRDFEWWGHPGKGYGLPGTFFAVAARERGGGRSRPWRARVLAAPPGPPLDPGGFGFPREQGAGLPHFRRASFRGEYPFAWLKLSDPAFPVRVELEAWNPLIPLEPDDSGLPLALLRYRLTNRGARGVEATAIGSIFNAVGLDGREVPIWSRHGSLGSNRSRLVRDASGLAGLHLTRDGAEPGAPRAGSIFLGVIGATHPTFQPRWPRGAWFDDLQLFWDHFTAHGRLTDEEDDSPSPAGVSDPAAIGERLVLRPGERADVLFALAWYFPNFSNTWNVDEPAVAGKPLRAFYATRFASALEVARHAAERLPELEAKTRAYHGALFGSTLPEEVLDAASSQSSTLRTNTCLRLDSGAFHAFEGVFDTAGCCPMDCTHVWNYAQALPWLWPALERSLRETGLRANLWDDGRQSFRTLLPLDAGARWDRKASADGQLGEIVKLYRDWRISGNTEWLRSLWPSAKRALEYAWVHWDADRDGVLEGEQHVTYDIELFGPNPMTGAIYLAALRAGAELARAVGDGASAARYRELSESGARRLDELCWNGEYYVQRVPDPDRICGDPHQAGSLGSSLEGVAPGEPPKYQFGDGCLSDQLVGQWLAHACGLGHVLPPRRVSRALRAVIAHNFRRDLREHANAQRVYALGDESGLLLCSWPRGGRPRLPFPYADEVWSGVEYQVAAHLAYEGQVREALALVRATRGRYDGRKRNPWDESECGHHYARAMSSWSLLHALSGFGWEAANARLRFAPRVGARDFRVLLTAGEGWGTFEQRCVRGALTARIRVLGGTLRLNALELEWPTSRPPARLALEGAAEGARLRRRGRSLEVGFPETRTVGAGESLRLTVRRR